MNKHNYTMRKISLACVLLAFSASVSAKDNNKIGFYFGAGISQTTLAVNQQNMAITYSTDPQSSFETNGLGLDLMVGIELDEYLSFEVAYTEIGSVALNNGTTQQKLFDADMFNISAVISHPVSQKVDVYGRLGMSYWSTLNEEFDTMESGSGIVYGAGFDINIYGNENRLLRVEWRRQEFDSITFESADTVSASAVFKF
ncbi:MAG: outer membrane beta-barrel protein [Gammaproteobacteria bacterium]